MLHLTKKSSEITEINYSPRSFTPLTLFKSKSCSFSPEFEILNDENFSKENLNLNFKEAMIRFAETNSTPRKLIAKYNKV